MPNLPDPQAPRLPHNNLISPRGVHPIYSDQHFTTDLRIDFEDRAAVLGKSFFTFKDAEITAVMPWATYTSDREKIPISYMSLFSISTHRDTYPVTSLGQFGIKGYTRGQKVFSGSVGFARGKSMAWEDILASFKKFASHNNGSVFDTFCPDQLPPFDLFISLVNTYGAVTTYIVSGMVLLDSSFTMSTEDLASPEMYSWMARTVQVLTKSENG